MGNSQSSEEEKKCNDWQVVSNRARKSLLDHFKRAKKLTPTDIQAINDSFKAQNGAESLCENSSVGELKFHPVLTESVYNALIGAVDLSYAASALTRWGATDPAIKQTQEKRRDQNLDTMKLSGFGSYASVHGKTGKENEIEDTTCITSLNDDKTVLIVAFHGSISNSTKEIFEASGDWGANFESDPIKAEALGLKFVPGDIELHEGYGRNFKSAQDELNEHLKTILDGIEGAKSRPLWVLVAGHSKGAAMANIAAPAIREYLKSIELSNVNVGVITVSSPRAFHGSHSQAWVHSVLGINNILRIHVEHDVVTMAPSIYVGDYRHVGLHFLDDVKVVNERVKQAYEKDLKENSSDYWLSLHYANDFEYGGSPVYNPKVMLPFGQLHQARIYASKHNDDSGIYSTY